MSLTAILSGVAPNIFIETSPILMKTNTNLHLKGLYVGCSYQTIFSQVRDVSNTPPLKFFSLNFIF